jgi:hypothetical protein
MPIPRAMDQLSRIVRYLRDKGDSLTVCNPPPGHCSVRFISIVSSISNAWSPFRPDNILDLSKFLFQSMPINKTAVH